MTSTGSKASIHDRNHDGALCRSILVAAALVVLIAGCSGGGGGSGGAMSFIDAVVEELGELPLDNVFLNSVITVEFSLPVDPDSVSTQTFRMLEGPDYVNMANGDIVVDGRFVRFFPALPTVEDLSDSGFQPGKAYRLVLRGQPDLNTIRSTGGKPLVATHQVEFAARVASPLYVDPVPGPPRIIALLVDLDGNGVLDGDGDPTTPEAEEFFEDEVDFDDTIPFLTDLRVGSSGLAPPHTPLRIGLLFDEPVLPGTLFRDSNNDRIPDAIELLDTTNPYPCDNPAPGDFCDRPITYAFEFDQTRNPQTGSFFVLATLRATYSLSELSRHKVSVRQGRISDLNDNRMLRSFAAVVETGTGRPEEDLFFEDFSSLERRDSSTTGLWNPSMQPFLKGGIGFGGDGSDGEFTGNVIDTRGNDGIFNFSGIPAFNVSVIGDKPAVIRIFGDFALPPTTSWEADGRDGAPARPDGTAPLPGGRGGPGGYSGGAASPLGFESPAGGDGKAPEGTEGGGGGAESSSGPGGGGGAAHRANGTRGSSGGETPGGDAGLRYGDQTLEILAGGSGGGAGGNNTADGDESLATTGGSGGGGGGLLILEAFTAFRIPAALPASGVTVDGGKGGNGSRPESGFNSGGGGGGSGGTLVFRGRELVTGEIIGARGGNPGTSVTPGGRGANGSDGYILVESLVANPRCTLCDPPAIFRPVPDDVLGKSTGRSRFFVTHADPGALVEYFFDGSVPLGPEAGRVIPEGDDILVLDGDGRPADSIDDLPPMSSINIFFRGAQEDPRRPDMPDPDTITPWVTDVDQLRGFTMIQWEVRFDIGGRSAFTLDPADDPPAPGVDNLRIRYRIP